MGQSAKRRVYEVGGSQLIVEFGDLTKSDADVLVSSDDTYLSMGGGVSAAILRAGGRSILMDAAKKTPAAVGDIVVTSAGSLKAKDVFHAVTLGNAATDTIKLVTGAA